MTVSSELKKTPVKPKTPQGKQTRERLIKAAIKSIGEQGIAATRVDDLVRAVGCAHGTFYKYFASKLDLVRQVMTEVYQEIHEEVLPPISPSSTPEDVIKLGLSRLARTVVRFGPILKTFQGSVGLDAELSSLRDSLLHKDVDEMARRIVQMEEAGYAQVGDPYLVSLALNSMADEMSRRWLLYEKQISEEAFIHILESIFETVLLGKRIERGSAVYPVPLTLPARTEELLP